MRSRTQYTTAPELLAVFELLGRFVCQLHTQSLPAPCSPAPSPIRLRSLEDLATDGETVASPDLFHAILAGLARAALHIEGQGYMHLDIKPDNLLLTAPSAQAGLQVRLADFGLARTPDEGKTTTKNW